MKSIIIKPYNLVLLGGLLMSSLIVTLGIAVINRLGQLGQLRQEEQYLEKLELLADDVEARLANLSTITLLTAEHLSSLPQPDDGGAIAPQLARIHQLSPQLRTVVIVNPAGTIVADMRDGQPALGVDVSDRLYFQIHLEDTTTENTTTEDIYVMPPVVSRVDGKWTWVLSAAARTEVDDLAAVVVTSLDRNFFSDIFASQTYIDQGFGVMVHASGPILEASATQQHLVGQALNDFSWDLPNIAQSVTRNYNGITAQDQGTLLQKLVGDWPITLVFFLDEAVVQEARTQSIGTTPYWILILLLAVVLSTLLLYANFRKMLAVEEKLWLSQEKLLQSQYVAKIGDFTWDVASGEVAWSQGAYRLLDYPEYEDITLSLVTDAIHHPDDNERVMQWLSAGMDAGKAHLGPLEYRLLSRSGEVIQVQTNVRISYHQGQATRVFGTILDVTELKQAEQQVRQHERKLKLLLHTTGSGILSVDCDGVCTSGNPAALRMLGYATEAELLGVNLHQTLHGRLADGSSYPVDQCPIMRVLMTHEAYGTDQEYFVRRNGDRFPIQLYANPIIDQGKTEGVVLSFIDISAQKQLEQQLYQQANHDALTHLPNRTLLLDRLKNAIATAAQDNGLVGVIFLDLDDFKYINDTLGHAVGDRLLQRVAQRLQQAIRTSDTVARMGGDEFVIILDQIQDSINASTAACKVLAKLSAPIPMPEGQLKVNASLGIAIYPMDGQDADTLLQAADTALYQAKEHGRGTYQYFAPAFATAAEEMHRVEQKLSRAVTQSHLAVAYQPIVSAQTGELEAVEALLRFQPLPDYRGISVFKAIQIAERNGLIIEIGDWSLAKAVQDVQQLSLKLGKPIRLHFNASSRQFLRDGFAQHLLTQLETVAFPVRSLVIEITESSLLRSPIQAEAIAQQLVDLGLLIALDDFGTGYSSLSYLAKFPVAIMKVDKSFVTGVEKNTKQAVILKSILDFGNTLGITTLCEGVEEIREHQIVSEFGCQQEQGYFYARPTSIDNIALHYGG
ncbi:MAG: EAL domain-containing protein [Leptolyngbyaceae cyanobacterium]